MTARPGLRPLKRLIDYARCALTLGVGWRAQWAIGWKTTKNIRVRLGLETYHPRDIYRIVTTFGPLHFRDNFGDITNLVDVLYHQAYPVGELPGEGAILDVGANIGLAAAGFAHANPGRAIYCFEPLAESLPLIRLNCPGALIEHVAVGAQPGQIVLNVDDDGVMASLIDTTWRTHKQAFEVVRLDDFVKAGNLRRIALLKIDAEGMEVDILQGGRETLKITDQVALETHGAARHQAAIDLLEQAGFKIVWARIRETSAVVLARRADGPRP